MHPIICYQFISCFSKLINRWILGLQQGPDFNAIEIALMPKIRCTSIPFFIDTLFSELEGKKCSQLKALVAVPSRSSYYLVMCLPKYQAQYLCVIWDNFPPVYAFQLSWNTWLAVMPVQIAYWRCSKLLHFFYTDFSVSSIMWRHVIL